MRLGVDKLVEAISASLKDRHRLDLQGRRNAVDGLAEFGAGPLERQLQWCKIGERDAVRFAPTGLEPTSAVLYLHGGAFVAGSPVSHQYLTQELADRSGMAVYSLAYRLAPEHKYPAALDDAIAAYTSLVETRRYEAVALAGDSAGASLAALAAARLRRTNWQQPSALALVSPLLDLRCVDQSFDEHGATDPMIARDSLRRDVQAFLGGHDAGSPDVSPLLDDLSGLPPTLIQSSNCEVLSGDSIKFAEKAEQAGVDITLRQYARMVHVWHLFPNFVSDADLAISELATFLSFQVRRPASGPNSRGATECAKRAPLH